VCKYIIQKCYFQLLKSKLYSYIRKLIILIIIMILVYIN